MEIEGTYLSSQCEVDRRRLAADESSAWATDGAGRMSQHPLLLAP